MKKFILLFLLSSVSLFSQADYYAEKYESGPPIIDKGYHKHDGFYLSCSLGMSAGPLHCKEEIGNNINNYRFSGEGFSYDFKIGGEITENLILHATFLINEITDPNGNYKKEGLYNNSNPTINEFTIGAGLTYYFMPVNIYLSGTLGFGSIDFPIDGSDLSSEKGFGFQFKAGKDWWLSDNWALGLSVGYSGTYLEYAPTSSSIQTWNSDRFALMIGLTFN